VRARNKVSRPGGRSYLKRLSGKYLLRLQGKGEHEISRCGPKEKTDEYEVPHLQFKVI